MEMTHNAHGRDLRVDLFAILFGMSAWIEVNGLWVEMPLLAQHQPEKWKLGSIIIVTTQIANLGPIAYSLAHRCISLKVLERPLIHITLATGTISCVFLAIFWDRTTPVGNDEHSVALLVLTLCLAFVDCTSSVLYLPFMAHFKSKYLISYLIGEGLSGLLPGVIALVQGTPETPGNGTNNTADTQLDGLRFSVSAFFVILASMVLISWGAFLLLNYSQVAKNAQVEEADDKGLKRASIPCEESSFNGWKRGEYNLPREASGTDEPVKSSKDCLLNKQLLNRRTVIGLLAVQGYCSALANTGLLSIQTYSSAPYGNTAYHLAVTLSSISNPLASFLAMFLVTHNFYAIVSLLGVASAASMYIIATALLSPEPPMVENVAGAIVMIIAWVSAIGLLSFIKTCVTSRLQLHGGHQALFWCGGVTQCGSAFGAIVTFLLVNYTHLFKQ